MQSSVASESGDGGRDGEDRRRPSGAESHGVKKRKVRKGTHSCWECRRRKTKCHFDPSNDQVCSGCRARGTACTSQEYVEERTSVPHERRVAERLSRLEFLMEQLVDRVQPLRAVLGQSPPLSVAGSAGDIEAGSLGGAGSTVSSGVVTGSGVGTPSVSRGLSSAPGSSRITQRSGVDRSARNEATTSPPQPSTAARPPNPRALSSKNKLEAARKALWAIFPTEHDARLIMAAQPGSQMASFVLCSDADIHTGRAELPQDIAARPPPDAHPVFLAKRLMQFCVSLQHMLPDFDLSQLDAAGGRTAAEIAMAYIEAVNAHVCLDDEMVACGEGLGVLYLYAWCQTNPGNLRRAWLAARRALSLAELMGVEKERKGPGASAIDLAITLRGARSSRPPNVSFFWFRLNYLERYLSLVLGLPSSSTDRAFHVARAVHMPNHRGHLECAHGLVAGRINDRNHGHHEKNPSDAAEWDGYTVTLSIDCDLEVAAKAMPPDWWEVPDMDLAGADVGSEAGRGLLHMWTDLILQCQHYTLLILLHLPYVMRDAAQCRWDYSKKMSLSASRQVLTRYARFRSGGCKLMSCRYMDYAGLVAGMTMVMGYLGKGPRKDIFGSETGEDGGNRREADRKLVGSVRRAMGELGEAKGDKFAKAAGDTLGDLIAVMDRGGEGATQEVIDMGVCLQVPYLGTVSICAVPGESGEGEDEGDDGIPGRRVLAGGAHTGEGEGGRAALEGSWVSLSLEPYLFGGPERGQGGNQLGHGLGSGGYDSSVLPTAGMDLRSGEDLNMYDAGMDGMDGGAGGQEDWMLQQPGLTAGENDWVFQGVDTTFWSLLNEGFSQQ